jgi:hypothetical protein
MSIILRVDGLLGNLAGTVYGGQVIYYEFSGHFGNARLPCEHNETNMLNGFAGPAAYSTTTYSKKINTASST